MFSLSKDQEQALAILLQWYKKETKVRPYITLGGYAGTGKTTFIAEFRKELHKRYPQLKIGFASYTGKAARVLRSKLQEGQVLIKNETAGTIHSLIYSPIINEREEIIGWKQKDKIDYDLLIIDEGSMVDQVIWNHLLSYHIPIFVVGDHGQLPPIQGTFHLVSKPDVLLHEIHRQARKNPIIGLSIQARESGYIRPGRYSDGVVKYSKEDPDMQDAIEEILQNYSRDTLILCGYNRTRKKLNQYIRASLGFESQDPVSQDRVICLRNNHSKEIFNGMLGTVNTIRNEGNAWYEAEIAMDDGDEYHGRISRQQFDSDTALNFTDKRSRIMENDLFDFGYALTVHKAQGSQARKVVLFEERFSKMSDDQWRRWLYTAVTRAEEELVIFET